MNEYHLSERADAELLAIFVQSLFTFGAVQARRYRESLTNCFELLGENPNMGRPAPNLGQSVRRHEHESHIILYRPAADGVLILALVPARSMRLLRLTDE